MVMIRMTDNKEVKESSGGGARRKLLIQSDQSPELKLTGFLSWALLPRSHHSSMALDPDSLSPLPIPIALLPITPFLLLLIFLHSLL